jgi:predicted secreted protein
MEVRTGRFGLTPRYAREGKLTGWQGSAELILEGQDIARISATAGKLQTLNVTNMSFGLTPLQRQTAQATTQSLAIALFRQRASEIAKSFDLTGYTLGEVAVNFDDSGPMPRPMMMSARTMASDTNVPVEAGLTSVSVTVSGSVQLK